MKIGLAQINTTVGDLSGNLTSMREAYQRLVEQGAEITVFPELVITGYPPRDLLFKRRFVPDNVAAAEEFAKITSKVPAVYGFVEPNEHSSGRAYFNAAAVAYGGTIQSRARKCLLPTYDVFDEDRYFQAADHPLVFEHGGRRIAVTICEDIWTLADIDQGYQRRYPKGPVDFLSQQSIDLHLNLSASPWHMGKNETRERLIKQTAKACRCPLVYLNAIGGNDELIFDGRSAVALADGSIHTGLSPFHEEIRIVDTETRGSLSDGFEQSELQDVEDGLILGLRDYAHKSGFRKALIGLSGGIDSAVTAAIAVKALGKDNVTGISLPSAISSQHSKTDAQQLAEKLGIAFHIMPIAEVVAAAESTLQPLISGHPRDVTEENIQARSRGLLLMALSNKLGALLLTTGNKSELAVGYCTLYGDMCGGLAVISDLPKTKVFELARHINRDGVVIPVNTIEKPPSAELREDQKDEDSLPAYPVLDAILKSYVEDGLSSRDIIAQGHEESVVKDVIRKVDLNEYKRKQAAPGLKLTPLAFGVGRRIPIVQRYVS